jgi:hypothetical protein
VRLAAASELWRLAEFDITKLAVRMLADPDQTVRHRTLRSLARSVPTVPPKPSLQRQIEVTAARDPDPANRALATVVARHGSRQPITLEEIHTAIAAGIPTRELAPALDRKALVQLEKLATARETNVAASAVMLATAIAARAARPIVEHAAAERRAKVREAAASVAGRVPGGSELLRALIRDKNPEVRQAAFLSAARTRLPELKEIATRLAKSDPDTGMRDLAADFLRSRPQSFR